MNARVMTALNYVRSPLGVAYNRRQLLARPAATQLQTETCL